MCLYQTSQVHSHSLKSNFKTHVLKIKQHQQSINLVIVSSSTVPVPGIFVQQILTNEFIGFDNLLPHNLSNGAFVQNSVASGVRKPKQVLPIRGFRDWADAWAVYVVVAAQYKPDLVQDLMGYFLLISKCERNLPCGAWKRYDSSFTKKVAGCPGQAWSQVDPSLWLTCKNPPSSGPKSNIALKKDVCLRWNYTFCGFNPCRYRHVCKVCSSPSHKASSCPTLSANDRRMQSKRKGDHRSPSPSPKKKHKPSSRKNPPHSL